MMRHKIPIVESKTTNDDLIFERGSVHAFHRLADFNKDGSIDMSQLRDDEIVVSPHGKIYRRLVK